MPFIRCVSSGSIRLKALTDHVMIGSIYFKSFLWGHPSAVRSDRNHSNRQVVLCVESLQQTGSFVCANHITNAKCGVCTNAKCGACTNVSDKLNISWLCMGSLPDSSQSTQNYWFSRLVHSGNRTVYTVLLTTTSLRQPERLTKLFLLCK